MGLDQLAKEEEKEENNLLTKSPHSYAKRTLLHSLIFVWLEGDEHL